MFNTIFTFVDTIINVNIAASVVILINVLTPLIAACVTLYAVYLAYQAMFNTQNLMVMESIKFFISLAAVTSIAFSSTYYLNNLVPILLNIGDAIAGHLMGGVSGAAALQEIFDRAMSGIGDLFDSISLSVTSGSSWITFFQTLALILINGVGSIAFIGVAFTYLLVAKVMMSFLLILGPVFIMMAFFPSTRSFFQAWTGQCFNYALLTIVYPLAFNLFLQLLNISVYSLPINTVNTLLTLIVFLALILISLQIPAFCSSLSGGIGINGLVSNLSTIAASSGVRGVIGGGVRATSNVARSTAGITGKGISAGASLLGKGKNKIAAG